MKKLILAFIVVFLQIPLLLAQNDLKLRIILIGDAGEINSIQNDIINNAINKNISGKTIALFLGDNIYPKGMELIGNKKLETEQILRSQFEGLRKNGVPVYFIPGNHDWDKSGPLGYDKIIAANKFIEAQNDSLLQIIPADACPGPFELPLSENIVLIAMDSEWWLHPFDKQSEKSDCVCKTKRDVLGRLSDIVERNRNKVVIFATHHPFDTYGSHGGYYSLKENIFPLTDFNKNLYIPLPIVGSLYPLLRRTFPPAQDVGNVLFKDMKKSVNDILKTHPNVIHVSGHEHTLQLIQGEILQVVSGAGSRHTPVKYGRGSLYATDSSGYALADIMNDNNIELSFFTHSENKIYSSFTYKKPYYQPKPDEILKDGISLSDSIKIKPNNEFDKVSNLHKRLFGKNYRTTWTTETTLPVLHLSNTTLTPTEAGGGMQTRSLRLIDTDKKEWVIRSIDKFPDAILPLSLNQTWASDVLKDNVSTSFPYAPLVVASFGQASGVAHANPKIVYVALDKKLGFYNRDFANTIVVLEEREPLGKSYSTLKMQAALKKDNDNKIDQKQFLNARLQDIIIGDWDRHGDQWRWVDIQKGKDKLFSPVPRDRDQVFYVNQGLFPAIVALPWILPKVQGFRSRIRDINSFNFNAQLIDGLFTNELNYNDWMKATQQIISVFNEKTIDEGLKKMPSNIYASTHFSLQQNISKRRDDLIRAIPIYYKFLNKVIDINTSDKAEQVIIKDTLDGKLSINIYKLKSSSERGKILYNRIIEPSITKSVNLYINGGEDKIFINNQSSPITIRIIGNDSAKKGYSFEGNAKYLRKIHVYEGENNASFSGESDFVHKHLSKEPQNTAQILTNRYNITTPLLSFGYNIDDGFLVKAGVKWINQGFRKLPYASLQQLTVGYAFSSSAVNFSYKGEWMQSIGKADLLLKINGASPSAQNFFGLGNQSLFNENVDFRRYYRTRFNVGNLSIALRKNINKIDSITAGTTFQYYNLDASDNMGRFINNTSQLHSYDSATVFNSKTHAGIFLAFTHDTRNNQLLPTFGSRINLKWQGSSGLNAYSKSYMQFSVDMIGYKSIDRKSNLVIANRIGAGVSVGEPAFYQSFFLGSHSNLYGFRQYRFGGEHIVYNNFEARLKLANLASYILPGELGLVGFYDIGKVWQKGFNDKVWHYSIGGGLYFAPAQMMVFQLVMAGSKEGTYPYFTAGFRF